MNWEKHKKQLLKDKEFRDEYNKLETEFKVARELIQLRLSAGMTQEELAKSINTKQASIARMESGSYLPSLSMIKRVAEALDADVEIKLKPKHSGNRIIS